MEDLPLNPTNKDEDLSLPKATVHKIVQDMLPEDVVCTRETKDLFVEICSGK